MPFDNSIKSMQTPTRVHALLKLLQYKPYSRDDLIRYLQPPHLNRAQDQTKEVIAFARNGDLIHEGDDKLFRLSIPSEDIDDSLVFRRTIIQKAYTKPDLHFHKFTAWFFCRGENVLAEKAKSLVNQFFKDVSATRFAKETFEYNETNIRGWMNWASFLGYGYVLEGQFIPNPAKRIHEEFQFNYELPRNEWIPFAQFMKWMADTLPELDGGEFNSPFNNLIKEQKLSYGLSAGLRTLHDLGIVQLNVVPDKKDIWHLTPSKLHMITSDVTDIMVNGGTRS